MFADRREAGQALGHVISHLKGDDVVVVGLPRGGVPVAEEVAAAIDAPLDVILVRKLGVPFHPELGMGAIGEGGVRVINDEVVRMARVDSSEIDDVESRERVELVRRAQRYRSGRDRIGLSGRVVVVVDDGIATGSTAKAACEVVRSSGARRVVLAVPVAPPDWIRRLSGAADEFFCVETPAHFHAVGQFYDHFNQTTDDEVIASLLRAARRRETAGAHVREITIEIPGAGAVAGSLTIPDRPTGLVLFSHGSGSSRHSPRNRHVASVLNRVGLATLLFDLLTPAEEQDRTNVFDIGLLGERLVTATRWSREQAELADLPIGYFGASTGAAAALVAAAEMGDKVAAVVSRGGRPDLAESRFDAVSAPTLLIVGSLDHQVLELNRKARAGLSCPSKLEVVPGATHLFEEPGTLDVAAGLASDWFLAHLDAQPRSVRFSRALWPLRRRGEHP